MKPAILSAAAFAALAFAALAFAATRAADPPKPNLVFFLMDDMGYGDVHPFNPDTKNRTPNIDRMAKEGMKLTSFYAAPVCTPSRAQVLTGCYAKRVSLPQVIMPASPIGLNRDEHTIAALLKAQGYATLCVGKWHVGDQPEFLPIHYGFDHYLGLPYSNDMGGEWDGADDPPPDKRKPPLPLVRDDKVIETLKPADQDRLTERYTDEALRFIRDHKDSPFFLYLAHTAVHVPLHPGAKFKGKSANGTYGDWVEESDASLGRVLDTLRELHLDENTLVIFSSDNGPWLVQGKNGGTAGPLRGGKGGTYEGGVREPTIAWQPGRIEPGSTLRCGRRQHRPAADVRPFGRRDRAGRPQDRRRGHCTSALRQDEGVAAAGPLLFQRQPAEGGAFRPVEAGGGAAKGADRQAGAEADGAVHAEALQPRRRHRRDDRRGRQAPRRGEAIAGIRIANGRGFGGDEEGAGRAGAGRVETPRPLLLK